MKSCAMPGNGLRSPNSNYYILAESIQSMLYSQSKTSSIIIQCFSIVSNRKSEWVYIGGKWVFDTVICVQVMIMDMRNAIKAFDNETPNDWGKDFIGLLYVVIGKGLDGRGRGIFGDDGALMTFGTDCFAFTSYP